MIRAVILVSLLRLSAAFVVNVTEEQRACWLLDSSAVLADHAAQLRLSHGLLLQQQQRSGATLPSSIAVELQSSLVRLDRLWAWLSEARLQLKRLFSGSTSGNVDDLPMSLSDLDALQASISSSSAWWSQHCPQDVLVEPLLYTFNLLNEQRRTLNKEVAAGAEEFFALRSERALAAGQMQAFEKLTASEATASKETLGGVFNVSRDAERLLWNDASLHKQATLVLVRAMFQEDKQAREPFQNMSSAALEEHAVELAGLLHEAAIRVTAADQALLSGGTRLVELIRARKDLEEKMKNHLKGALAQCLPPSAEAAKSRYARFTTSSPASSAVQLIMESVEFLSRTSSQVVPDLMTAVETAQAEARSGATLGFHEEPALARWWEWLPSLEDGSGFLGFQGFMEHYQKAVQEHGHRLAHGGHRAALHSVLTRWQEVAQEREESTALEI